MAMNNADWCWHLAKRIRYTHHRHPVTIRPSSVECHPPTISNIRARGSKLMEEIEKEEGKSRPDYIKILRDAIFFYTTAFFVLLLIFRLHYFEQLLKWYLPLLFPSCVSFCFLVPFVIGKEKSSEKQVHEDLEMRSYIF